MPFIVGVPMFPLATKFRLGEARRQYIDTQLRVNCVSASKQLKGNDIQAGINNWRLPRKCHLNAGPIYRKLALRSVSLKSAPSILLMRHISCRRERELGVADAYGKRVI
jgi:hypothetical protein